jgi:hypothetical protein
MAFLLAPYDPYHKIPAALLGKAAQRKYNN